MCPRHKGQARLVFVTFRPNEQVELFKRTGQIDLAHVPDEITFEVEVLQPARHHAGIQPRHRREAH